MLKSHLPAGGNPLDLEVSRLRKAYSTEPIVIDGIVGESPQSTMSARVFGGGYRIHLFSFAAWRISDGPVRTDGLVLSRAVPNSSNSGYQLDRYSYHRIRILLSGDETRAVVLEGLEPEDCTHELASIAESLARPFALDHDRFGTLLLDRGLELFSGTTTWDGADVEFTFPAHGEKLDASIANLAESLFENETEISQRVSQFLVASVVSEHDEDLVAGEINSRLVLEGINLTECESVEFWYDDDDLWGGHSLVVRFTQNDQMTFAVEG